MKKANWTLDKDFVVGEVDKRLFGGFVEHMGRCVYDGIYEPGHPTADALGFRNDVKRLVKDMHVSILRYPGGNFVSGYNWRDGIGPREKRPRRLSLAWSALETNEVGTDEFCDWAREVGAEPMLSVNLGTGTPDEARAMIEYVNHPAGTELSDLRIQNGHREPHNVKLWCLGNEMDGPWQIGHKTKEEYARLACETAKLMKWVDPTIELVACGSSAPGMPDFPAWEAVVLDECYEHVDYISMHTYYDNPGGTHRDLLSRSLLMERYIRDVAATCDYIAAKKRQSRRIHLSYDEWNVWFSRNDVVAEPKLSQCRWEVAPALVEGRSNLADAVLVGMMLINLIRNADRVKIGCMSELVNVLGPIMTEKGGAAFCNSVYYPFAQAAKWASGGTALNGLMRAPLHSTRYCDDVPMVEGAAVLRGDGTLALFVANRDMDEDAQLHVDLRAFGALTVKHHEVMTHSDPLITNAAGIEPLRPMAGDGGQTEAGRLCVVLPRLSWNVLVLG